MMEQDNAQHALWVQARALLAEQEQKVTELNMLAESAASTLSALSHSLQSLIREREVAQKHAQDLQSQISAGKNELQTINLRLQEQDTGRAMMARNLMALKSKLAAAPQSIQAEQVKYSSQLNDLKGNLEAYKKQVFVQVEN